MDVVEVEEKVVLVEELVGGGNVVTMVAVGGSAWIVVLKRCPLSHNSARIIRSLLAAGEVCGENSPLLLEYLEAHLSSPSTSAHQLQRSLRTRLGSLYIARIARGEGLEGGGQGEGGVGTMRQRLAALLGESGEYDADELLKRVGEAPGVLEDTSVIGRAERKRVEGRGRDWWVGGWVRVRSMREGGGGGGKEEGIWVRR